MTSMARTHPPDQTTRISGAVVGIIVFLAGIALIGSVFLLARALFDSPPPVIPASAFAAPVASPSGSSALVAPSATAAISENLVHFVEKLVILLVMCIVGSLIASKGIDLFFKAHAAPRQNPPGGSPPGP
jgi:hypothetical protein